MNPEKLEFDTRDPKAIVVIVPKAFFHARGRHLPHGGYAHPDYCQASKLGKNDVRVFLPDSTNIFYWQQSYQEWRVLKPFAPVD
jgi:hypothetical protein